MTEGETSSDPSKIDQFKEIVREIELIIVLAILLIVIGVFFIKIFTVSIKFPIKIESISLGHFQNIQLWSGLFEIFSIVG